MCAACFIISASFTLYELFLQRNIKIDRVFLFTSITYTVCQLAMLITITFFYRPFLADDSSGLIISASLILFIQKISCLSTLFYILAIQYMKIVLTSSNLDELQKMRKKQNYLTIFLLCVQFCNFLGMVVGRRYSNQSVLSLSTLIYSLIQLIAVLSFIPSVRFFIFRRQEKNDEKKGTFAENQWPWVLVALNILRNSALFAVAFAQLIVAQTQDPSSDAAFGLSIADKINYMLVPPIDLCTGMSILFLYHILGKDKMNNNEQA